MNKLSTPSAFRKSFPKEYFSYLGHKVIFHACIVIMNDQNKTQSRISRLQGLKHILTSHSIRVHATHHRSKLLIRCEYIMKAGNQNDFATPTSIIACLFSLPLLSPVLSDTPRCFYPAAGAL